MRWLLLACLSLTACGKKHDTASKAPDDGAAPARAVSDAAPATTECDTDDGLAHWVAGQRGTAVGKLDCVQRAADFPGVILVGSFANDRGCMPDLVILDCKRRDGPLPASLILNRAGWGGADADRRETLALRYLRQVATVFDGTIADTPDPPKTETNADGQVTVEVWIDRPAGMRAGRVADRVRYSFRSDGRVTSETIGHLDERR